MQKINYLIFLIVFLALVITTGMAQTVKKLGDTYCTTSNVDDTYCGAHRCYNSSSYIHDCDTYIQDNCDNFTTLFVLCNSTGNCRNTTRDVRACYSDISDNCGSADIVTHCCTNGVCHNRTSHVHGCYNLDSLNELYNRAAASICAGDDYACNPFFPYDPTCVDRVITGLRRRLGISK